MNPKWSMQASIKSNFKAKNCPASCWLCSAFWLFCCRTTGINTWHRCCDHVWPSGSARKRKRKRINNEFKTRLQRSCLVCERHLDVWNDNSLRSLSLKNDQVKPSIAWVWSVENWSKAFPYVYYFFVLWFLHSDSCQSMLFHSFFRSRRTYRRVQSKVQNMTHTHTKSTWFQIG